MSRGGRLALLTCAALNIVFHLVGLVLAATAMRAGSPLAPLEQRLRYLAMHPSGWSLGWAAWMLCALLSHAGVIASEPGGDALDRTDYLADRGSCGSYRRAAHAAPRLRARR